MTTPIKLGFPGSFGLVWLALIGPSAAGQPPIALQLTPGETRILVRDHVPPGGREIFAVKAAPGQTLLLECDAKDSEATDPGQKLTVWAPGAAGSPPWEARTDGQWLNRLPAAGVYRVVVDWPSRRGFVLRLTLMDPNDPRLDPGVTARKVTVNLAPLGIAGRLSLQAFEPQPLELTGEESWPANLAVIEGEKLNLRIMAAEGIRKTFWRFDGSHWAQSLARLAASLQPGARPATPFDLPMNYASESELDFAAAEKRVDGPSFRALRWLANFSTPSSSPRNPMTYVAEGLSADGRLFLILRAEIRNPAVEGLPEIDEGPPLDALRKRVAAKLAAAPPSSFQPSLATLDAIVQSIKLRP